MTSFRWFASSQSSKTLYNLQTVKYNRRNIEINKDKIFEKIRKEIDQSIAGKGRRPHTNIYKEFPELYSLPVIKIELFTKNNFEGERVVVMEEIENISYISMDNKVNSMRITPLLNDLDKKYLIKQKWGQAIGKLKVEFEFNFVIEPGKDVEVSSGLKSNKYIKIEEIK